MPVLEGKLKRIRGPEVQLLPEKRRKVLFPPRSQPAPIDLYEKSGTVSTDLPATDLFQSFCSRYQASLKKPDQLKALIKFAIQQDVRFTGMTWDPGIEDILQDNQIPDLGSAPNKLIKKLQHDLACLIKRGDDAFKPNGLSCKQSFGHIASSKSDPDVYTIENGYTFNSKDTSPDCLSAHAASVTLDGKVIAQRSGKSDTCRKLKQKLLHACLASAQTASNVDELLSKAVGFHRLGDGTWEFRSTIVSGLDQNSVKAFFSKAEENEKRQLKNLVHAAQELFQKADSGISLRIKINDDEDISVRIRKPEIINITLSWQSLFASNIERHRQFNQAAACQMFQDLAQQWQKCCPLGVSKVFVNDMQACKANAASIQTFLLKHAHTLQDKVGKDTPARMALEWFYITFTNQTSCKKPQLHPESPATEAILLKYLLDELNSVPGPECKSGVDRTLTLLSIFTAVEAFKKDGAYFNPLLQEGITRQFRDMFTSCAHGLGASVLKLMRGAKGKINFRSPYVTRLLYQFPDPSSGKPPPLGVASGQPPWWLKPIELIYRCFKFFRLWRIIPF